METHGGIVVTQQTHYLYKLEHNDFEVSVENSNWEIKKAFGNTHLDLRKVRVELKI